MRIGIDLRWLHQALTLRTDDDCTGGIGTYSYSLVDHLLRLDRENQYLLFGSSAYPKELLTRYFKVSDRLKLVLLPKSPQITLAPATMGRLANYLYQRVVVGPAVRRQRPDIMHFLEQGAVLLGGQFKTVVSVMDMATSAYIDEFFKSLAAKAVWRWHISRLKKADKIVAISENTSRELVTLAGVEAGKITVIPLGVPWQIRQMSADDGQDGTLREYMGVKGIYFLYVGGLQFNKNIPGLMKAFAKLAISNPSVGLVLAGEPKFWPTEKKALDKLISNLGLAGRVKDTGWVTTRQLAALYRGAVALVHTSFYEGFGLTPLEAMFYGCPVIASNASSLPEVVGEAGLLRDPRKPEEFARAMEQVLSEGKLRESLIRAGKKRAGIFSWEETARRTLKVYKQTMI